MSKKLLDEFLSDTSEIHAMWFGFYSAWFKLMRGELSDELNEDIKYEYQYFSAGFFIGRVMQAILLFFGVVFVL